MAAMSDRLLVLDAGKRTRRHRLPEGAELVRTHGRVRDATSQPRRTRSKPTVWLAPAQDDLVLFKEIINESERPKGNHRLVVADRVGQGRGEVLRALFDLVISADRDVKLLPVDELIEALSSPARDDLLIGLALDRDDNLIAVYRGSLEPLIVPASFLGEGASTALAEGDFQIVDFGHAIRFGDCEASADAILYAFDAAYRRRRKAQLVRQDRSFGGALRRLRMLRGVSRSDFDGVSSKEIARIERGEVKRPQAQTLGLIARRLGVAPDEIATY
jgi:hypothetical protein